MQVTEFLKTVQAHPELPLLFEFRPGQSVQGGYHVTEIKNASYETIDCGNSLHTWQEVIVQIWVPEEATPEDAHMSAGKFAKIWQVVDGRLHLYRNAEIRIEYGDGEHLTANYQVDQLVVTENGLRVKMAPPQTQCKAREILIPLNGGGSSASQASCCTPADTHNGRQETIMPLPVEAIQSEEAAGASCCAPAAGERSSCC